MRIMNKSRWHLIALVIYLMMVFVISHVSLASFRLPIDTQWDKVCHFVEYIPVGFLLFGWLIHRKATKVVSALAISLQALGLLALLGIADEIHQSFVPLRQPSFFDAVADVIGGFVGISFGLTLWRRRVSQSQSETTS